MSEPLDNGQQNSGPDAEPSFEATIEALAERMGSPQENMVAISAMVKRIKRSPELMMEYTGLVAEAFSVACNILDGMAALQKAQEVECRVDARFAAVMAPPPLVEDLLSLLGVNRVCRALKSVFRTMAAFVGLGRHSSSAEVAESKEIDAPRGPNEWRWERIRQYRDSLQSIATEIMDLLDELHPDGSVRVASFNAAFAELTGRIVPGGEGSMRNGFTSGHAVAIEVVKWLLEALDPATDACMALFDKLESGEKIWAVCPPQIVVLSRMAVERAVLIKEALQNAGLSEKPVASTTGSRLREAEVEVLQKLAKSQDEQWSQDEIINAVHMSRSRVQRILKKLEGLELVHRPFGERSGYSITSLGLGRLQCLQDGKVPG